MMPSTKEIQLQERIVDLEERLSRLQGSGATDGAVNEFPNLHALLLESVTAAVTVIDEKGSIRYANPAADKLFGFEPGHLAGTDMALLSGYGPEDNERRAAEVVEALRAGGAWTGEWLNRRRNGELFHSHIRLSEVKGFSTRLFVCVQDDITERKLEETSRYEKNERYRRLFETSREGIVIVDSDGRYVDINESYCRTLKAPRERLIGAHFSEFIPPERLSDAEEAFTALMQGGATPVDFPLKALDGTIVQLEWASSSHFLPGLYLCACRDVSERFESLRREQELRATAELLNSAGPILAAELDPERLVQSVTDIATSLIGAQFGAFFHNVVDEHGESYMLYTLSGVPRETFSRFPMPRNTAIFAPTFHGEGVLRSDDITKDSRYGQTAPYHGMPEGHLPVRSYLAIPVQSRSGEVLGGLFFGHSAVGVFAERHERLVRGIAAQAAIGMDNAQLFEELKRERLRTEEINVALRQANSDLEQFAFSASHDLQEPLRMVSIYSQLLQMQFAGKLGPDGDEYLQYAVQGASRMEELVRGLLAYMRTSSLDEAAAGFVDANHVLERAISNLQVAIKQTQTSVVSGPLPAVRVPQFHLEQLFQNLIGNAIKYRREDPALIRVMAERREGLWVFSVADNGIGIEARYRDQIFGIFKRLHSASQYPGAGIGLAICKRVVERAGGIIWVESELGRGSTFLFTLPDESVRGLE